MPGASSNRPPLRSIASTICNFRREMVFYFNKSRCRAVVSTLIWEHSDHLHTPPKTQPKMVICHIIKKLKMCWRYWPYQPASADWCILIYELAPYTQYSFRRGRGRLLATFLKVITQGWRGVEVMTPTFAYVYLVGFTAEPWPSLYKAFALAEIS